MRFRWLRRTAPYRIWRYRKDLRLLRRRSPREVEAIEFYSQFVRPGDLVFDVGANLGNRTKLFLALRARVVAVEPQAYCVRVLRSAFGRHPDVSIVQVALGATPGETMIRVGEANTISSMSDDWIRTVRATGRFGAHEWSRSHPVSVTTVDALRDRFGEPAFIKIDVEGYEAEVLAGMSRPVSALSFEFTPEFPAGWSRCLDRLDGLGPHEANLVLGESFRLELPSWVPTPEIRDALSRFADDHSTFGDVYVRSPR